MPTIKENLIAAKALIDTPEKWAHHSYERKVGGPFDAVDAIERVTGGWELVPVLKAHLQPPHDGWSVTHFNQHHDTTHADIMALFDRAIAAQDGG